MLTEVKKIDHYPSASGIEYLNNQFYIIGDDAKDLLVLQDKFTLKDSIPLYSSAEKRIPKTIKADLEGITVIADNKLLLIGSGSLSPNRNTAWIVDLITRQEENVGLDSFYQRLQHNGLKEINIEGITSIPGQIILSNRGNKSNATNHLIIADEKFWEKQSTTAIHTILLENITDGILFNGVSGLAYAAKSKQLICAVSTEDTRNSFDDGTIGKSYLWIVKNISTKIKEAAITPDKIIDLEKSDHRFEGQKIESACIIKETKKSIYLALVADNDDGSSTIFKITIPAD